MYGLYRPALVGFLALAVSACGSASLDRYGFVADRAPLSTTMSYSSSDYVSRSDALMNFAESNFTSYFPAHVATAQLTDPGGYPIRYRSYSTGWMAGTYWWGLGVPRIYYSTNGGATWNYYGTLEDGNVGLCGGQCWANDMQSEISGVMKNVLNLTGNLTSGGLTQQFTIILQAVFSSSQSFCPRVTTNPSLSSLSSLPATLEIGVNYGAGCTASDGSTMSGSASLVLTNMLMTSTSFSAHAAATFNNLYKNGAPFANGSVTGDMAFTGSGGSLGGTAVFHVASFLMPNGEIATGDISIQPTGTSLGSFNATLNTATQITPLAGLNLDAGSQQLALAVQTQADKSQVVNGTGTMYGYSMQFTNLLLNSTTCPSYPIGGSVKFTKYGKTATITYGPGCSGGYTYTQS